eukprot:Opistho-1_new@86245
MARKSAFVWATAVVFLVCAHSFGAADGACTRQPERGRLLSATLDAGRSVTSDQAREELVRALYRRVGPLALLFLIAELGLTYDTARYEVVYETVDPFGCPAVASGVVAVPKNANATLPMTVYLHGTKYERFYRTGARPDAESELVIPVFSSSGHIVLLPDYLGFESSDMLHPYVHAATLGSVTTDLIVASRALLPSTGATHNGQLFLTGYSEGGYATMAALREVQARHGELGVSVTAASPMAGPHDISTVFFELFSQPNATYSSPVYIVFTMAAYHMIYPADVPPLAYVFRPEYMDDINAALAGNRSTFARLNNKLPVEIALLFTDAFARDIANPTHPLRKRLAENDMDASPIVPASLPIVFRHCPDDELVPFNSSVITVERLRSDEFLHCPTQSTNSYIAGHTLM